MSEVCLFSKNLWNGECFSSYSQCLQILTLEYGLSLSKQIFLRSKNDFRPGFHRIDVSGYNGIVKYFTSLFCTYQNQGSTCFISADWSVPGIAHGNVSSFGRQIMAQVHLFFEHRG